jgi:hypothetical protein
MNRTLIVVFTISALAMIGCGHLGDTPDEPASRLLSGTAEDMEVDPVADDAAYEAFAADLSHPLARKKLMNATRAASAPYRAVAVQPLLRQALALRDPKAAHELAAFACDVLRGLEKSSVLSNHSVAEARAFCFGGPAPSAGESEWPADADDSAALLYEWVQGGNFDATRTGLVQLAESLGNRKDPHTGISEMPYAPGGDDVVPFTLGVLCQVARYDELVTLGGSPANYAQEAREAYQELHYRITGR